MPCTYDDVPGSWGKQSEGWPAMHDPDGRARMLVIKEKLVPYGSYVTVGDMLRLERQEYVEKVSAALSTPQARPDGGDGSLTYTEQRKVVEHMTTELRSAISVLEKTLQRAEAIDCQPLVTTANGGAVVYVECRQCDECEHTGINDEHPTDAACHDCDWSGPSPIEDKRPGCGDTDCLATACPKCGARYRLLAEYAHPAPAPDVARTDWPAGIADRVKTAAQRIEDNRAPRRIPADPTDVDLVLAEVDAYLSGQPAPFWLTAAQQEADRG